MMEPNTSLMPGPMPDVMPGTRPGTMPGLAPGEAFESLTEAECRMLLATQSFGRVGLTSGGLPVILPVRYSFCDDAVTFRTGAGTKLRAAESGDVLAFEVDAYDHDTNEGWSVLVLGRARVLTTEHDGDARSAIDPPEPGEPRNHYVRVHCEMISGRRLTSV